MQRTISRYVLLEQVGSTGLATVYRAQDPVLRRDVALKILRPYVSTDEALLERFSQEMERVARLNHPSILPVYGMESEGGIYWVTMQYVSWPTLRQWLQKPIPAAQAVVILKQVAEAIEAAQREGIYHGDIKPGNIFVDPETGQVLVSDFGMALLAEGAPPSIRVALSTPLPTYTAPERGHSVPPSTHSDIYSMGVLAYDMLTGTVPFNALDRASVQARQLTSVPVKPSQVNPNVPEQLDAVVMKALVTHPDLRYETPGEFARAFAEAAPTPADMPFAVVETGATGQSLLPGLESLETAPEVDTGPQIVCTVCGHPNPSKAVWCSECWGTLSRVAAVPGEKVFTSVERVQRQKREAKRRRLVLLGALLVVGVYIAVQYLNITLPLPTPSTSISSESGPGEWAMINRTFEGSGPVPGESASLIGEVKWTFKSAEPLASTPAVKDGRVYLTTQDKRVVALDAATGGIVWEHATVAPVDSSPAVAGGLLFYGARNKRVIALDADTGDERWEFVTRGNLTLGSPIVKDGVVYIGSGDSYIYALDALTGSKLWDFPTRDWITNTPALSDDKLVVSSLDGWVTIYDVNTGKKRFSLRAFEPHVMASPIIVGDKAYVVYRSGLLTSINLNEKEVLFQSRWYRLQVQLFVWDIIGNPGLPKGVNWGTRLRGTVVNTPSADENAVFVPTEEGVLNAVDRRTGVKLWSTKVEAGPLSTPTLVEDVVLVGGGQGKLYAIDKESGEVRWALPINERPIYTPVLADGTLYVTSKDGVLYAVK